MKHGLQLWEAGINLHIVKKLLLPKLLLLPALLLLLLPLLLQLLNDAALHHPNSVASKVAYHCAGSLSVGDHQAAFQVAHLLGTSEW